MARRASSSTNPIWFIVVAVIAVAAIAGGWLLKSRVSDPYRTTPAFQAAEYYKDSNSLRGNTFKLDGVVGDQLRFTKDGRLFAVEAEGNPVPVIVPQKLNDVNIRKGQRYLFRVEVGEKGIIRALEIKEA